MTPRILLVEDDAPTLEEMASGLKGDFPEAVIECASTVLTAHALIEAAERKAPYDVVVLDFKLPRKRGWHPEVDESLCLLASGKSYVIHITSYVDDAAVMRHVRQHHTGAGAPALGLIDKEDVLWPDKLAQDIRQHFAGRAVDQALAAVFLDPSSSDQPAPSGALSATHALGAAQRAVVEHWPNLDERHRAKVRQYFFVTERDGTVEDLGLLRTVDELE